MARTKSILVGLFASSTLLAAVPASAEICVTKVNGEATVDGCVTLYAGQTIDAGTVCSEVINDTQIDVTYSTTGGWELKEAHLWIGTQLSDMPQTKKGNPKIGNFPYVSGDITGETSHTFSVNLDELGFVCPREDMTYHIAAHAALRMDNGDGSYQTETGWSDGEPIVEKGSWATYTDVELSCNCDGDGGGGDDTSCETAYGTTLGDGQEGSDSMSACFFMTAPDRCDADGDGEPEVISNNWGWMVGPIAAGSSYSLNLHAGAGQCDTGRGYLAGTVNVDYDNEGFLTVYVSVDEPGQELGAVQVFAEYFESCTGAPGQYTILGNSGVYDDACDTTFYEVSADGFSGEDIFLIVHAEVCPEGSVCEG